MTNATIATQSDVATRALPTTSAAPVASGVARWDRFAVPRLLVSSICAAVCCLALAACANEGGVGDESASERQGTQTPDSMDLSGVVANDDAGEATPVDGSGAGSVDLATRVQNATPTRTRAGWLVFRDPALMVPEALPHFAARLADKEAPAEVRFALAEALGHTTADPTTYVVAAYGGEEDAGVRAALVETLTLSKGANAASALALLETAFSDADVKVRLAAVLCVTRRPDGATVGDSLVTLIGDSDVAVRAAAARGAGVLGISSAQPLLRAALKDAEPTVRLNALRAIDRIDPTYLASEGLLEALKADSDAKVSRLAGKIASR